ncbi:MAG: glycerophosphodiester phosphodiesterase [Firmicutes bacterium]|nr:glycerophosphodiester phosphodiesterase [Bacillota bacterium]
MAKTQIWAHRGEHHAHVENTLAAFAAAFAQGADGIELDVHLSQDRQLVVHHDEQVVASNGTRYPIFQTPAVVLRSVALCSNAAGDSQERIPLLEEVLALAKSEQRMVNIEIKNGPIVYPGIEEAVIAAVRDAAMEEQVLLSSFNHATLQRIRQLTPTLATGILYAEGLVDPWRYAHYLQAGAIHPLFYNITPQLVEHCHQAQIRVHPWTVNGTEDLEKCMVAGCDAVITDEIDRALQIRDQRL